MTSGLQPELREALRLRLEPQVQEANLPNCRAAFQGGSAVYQTPQLYGFFNLSGMDASEGDNIKDVFDRDFVKSIELLESTPVGEVRLFEMYPLMRRILVLMEGYLCFVGRTSHFEGTLAYNYSMPPISLYEVLDSLYDEVCGGHHGKESLINDLETMLGEMEKGLDSVLISLSGFINLLVPVIANSFENEHGNILEGVIATFTFGALQRIAAHFLLLVVIDRSVFQVSKKRPSDEKLLILTGDDSLHENVYRLDFLCKETLCKALTTKITDHYFTISWQDDIVQPIITMMQYSFLTSTKIISCKEVLADVVVATAVGFIAKIPNDCNPSPVYMNRILGFGSKLIHVFAQGLEQVNVALWSHFEMQLQHVLKLQNNRHSQSTEASKLTISGSSDNSADSTAASPSKSCQPPTRSLSTMISATEVKGKFNELLAILEYYVKRHEEIFEVIFPTSNKDNELEIVDNLSQLFSHFANLVQLGDALLYITQRSPNAEIVELIKQTITSMWTVIKALGDRTSFGVIKACFYNLGSEFHKNVSAQICCFNMATRDITKIKDAYESNDDTYLACVDMLRALLRGSSSLCCTCVSYRQNKVKRLSTQYLTVSSSFLGRWFIMEVMLGCASEKRGLIDAFIEWCHSDTVEEYMAARFLCRLITRLAKADQSFMDCAQYVLEVLLGVCLQFGPEERGIESMLTPLRPERLNAFRCLSVLLENGIFTEWMLSNVIIPYTCALTSEIKLFTGSISVDSGDPSPHNTFECYLVKKSGKCNCMEAPIINGSPSVKHYLELLSNLLRDSNMSIKEDHGSSMLKHVLVVLSGLVRIVVQFLHNNKDRGDIESRFAIFVLSAKITSVLVDSGNFGRKNNQVVLILKLYSLLGDQKICIPESVELYLSLILQALCVFHGIFDHVPVKDQLQKLHNGFLSLLLSKISAYPGFLLRHELYKGVPAKLLEQLSGHFPNVLKQSKSIGNYLRAMYNFKVWTVCRDYKVEREAIKKGYIEEALKDQEEPPELRIMLNTAFLVFIRLSALARASDTPSLLESSSGIGRYNK